MTWQLEYEIIGVLEKILRQMEVEEMVRPFNRGIYVMPSAQEAYEHGPGAFEAFAGRVQQAPCVDGACVMDGDPPTKKARADGGAGFVVLG